MTGTIRGKETQEENQVKMEAGTGAQEVQDQECQGLWPPPRSKEGFPIGIREDVTFSLNFWP